MSYFQKSQILDKDRIKFLDGLRGLAILAVIFFHAFSRWNEIEPFKHSKLILGLFEYGWLGVQLFFAISGYVIYRSVLSQKNLLMFTISRYLRLAPSMFIASILIFASSFLIPERPEGAVKLIDFIPSISFINPEIISQVTNLDVDDLEGVFWSLYIEVKFYLIVGIVFFIFKDKNLICIHLLFFFWLILGFTKIFITDYVLIYKIFYIMGDADIKYLGWFLIGVCAYKFDKDRSIFKGILLLVVSLSAVLTTSYINLEVIIASTIISLLFLIPIFFLKFRSIFSNKFLLFFGFISYPLYLVHQNFVTGMAIKLYNFNSNFPSYMYPLIFLIIIVFIAFLITKYERKLNRILRSFVPDQAFGFDLKKNKFVD